MDTQKAEKLLTEYRMNIELWKHDDTLRTQRNTTFLSLNTFLTVVLGSLITLRSSIWDAVLIAGIISVFGFPICVMWYYIQIRNAEYVRFRRFQLRSIEAQLGDVTTITNQWKALNQFETLSFSGIEDKFSIKPPAKLSATGIEGQLPLAVAGFWLLVFLSAITIAILHSAGWI